MVCEPFTQWVLEGAFTLGRPPYEDVGVQDPLYRRFLRGDMDGEIARSAAVVASWARYAEGTDERGEPIEVVDQLKDRVTANARNGSFIENRDRFGDLAENRRSSAAYEEALNDLHEHGARRTLERCQSV